MIQIGRDTSCPCGSGKKYKKCCMDKDNSLGIYIVKQRIVSRSLDTSRGESAGFGFMRKDGVTIDEENFKFAKFALVYVIRGIGEYVDPTGHRYELRPGTVFLRHPGILHSTYLEPESGWRECFIDFGRLLYDALAAYKIIKPSRFVYHASPDKSIELDVFTLMEKLENCGEAELPSIVSDTIALTTRILRRCESAALDDMDVFIDESCAKFAREPEQRLDLEKYCTENGVGYENFRKHFRGKVGVSPGRFIINRRIDAACEMLRMSKKPISEIAFDLNYYSPYEFSAQFKKTLGVSPKHYRR